MSALPTAFAIPPSVPVKPAESTRNRRGAPPVGRSSDGQHGLRIVPNVKNSLPDFTSLYHAYRRRIYAQCFYMLQNHVDAERRIFFEFRKQHLLPGCRMTPWERAQRFRQIRQPFHGKFRNPSDGQWIL